MYETSSSTFSALIFNVNFPSRSVIVPFPFTPFSNTLAPMTGSLAESITIPLTTTTFSCCGDSASTDSIIFLSSTEYFTLVPAKISFNTLKILLLSAETDTRRFKSTCLLLKKKSKSDCSSISFRMSSTR